MIGPRQLPANGCRWALLPMCRDGDGQESTAAPRRRPALLVSFVGLCCSFVPVHGLGGDRAGLPRTH